jgi:hypothetical protein
MSCPSCTDGLGMVTVREGDSEEKLCITCVSEYHTQRPDTDEPMPEFLEDFVTG